MDQIRGAGWVSFPLPRQIRSAVDIIERSGHPAQHRMAEVPLNVSKDLTGIGLIPAPVQVLGRDAKLDYEIARQVFRLYLAALFSPKADRRRAVLGEALRRKVQEIEGEFEALDKTPEAKSAA